MSTASSLTNLDWNQAQWSGALCRVPALVAILGLAVALHQTAAGVVCAGACLSVGLVGRRRIAGSSFRAMLATNVVMALSAWIGTRAGGSVWLNLPVTAVWGLIFGFLAVCDEDAGWVAMQGVIVLVLAMSFPNHGYAALGRMIAVLAGGMLQICLVLLLERGHGLMPAPDGKEGAEGIQPHGKNQQWSDFLPSFKLWSAAWQYAARVALTLIIAVEAARFLALQNGYWLPMTTIIILKPDFYRTYSGAVQRVAGTFIGVVLASLIAHLFHPGQGLLLVLIAIFSFGCFALLKVNPILFSAALTAYVIFLIATTGLPEASVTGHRLILTALGSALALGSRFLGYHNLLVLFGNKWIFGQADKDAPITNQS